MATRIYIPDPYIGVDSQNQRVWPGEYDIDDPLLFGVGRSLVETGYARIVQSDTPTEPEGEPPPAPPRSARLHKPKAGDK